MQDRDQLFGLFEQLVGGAGDIGEIDVAAVGESLATAAHEQDELVKICTVEPDSALPITFGELLFAGEAGL